MPKKRIYDYLDRVNREQIGSSDNLKIVPAGLVTEFEEYHYLGVQQPRYKISFSQMRNLAENNIWVEAAIRAICNQMQSLELQIVPKKKYLRVLTEQSERGREMRKAKSALENLFELQTSTYVNFNETISAICRDLLIYDTAYMEIIRITSDPKSLTKKSDRKGRIVSFMPRDAANIFIDHDEHGIKRRYIQTGIKGKQPAPMTEDNVIFNLDLSGTFAVFDRHDMIHFRLHPKSSSAYGSPPILALITAIQADLAADKNIGRFMATGGIVPGFIAADEELDPTITKRLTKAFQRIQMSGAKELPIISGVKNSRFIPIAANSREMEQNQLQNYYMKKILAIYQVPPHVLNLTDGVNRGIAFAQNDNFEMGAIIPIKRKIERMLNDQVVSEFNHMLCVRFVAPESSDKETQYNEIERWKQFGLATKEEMAAYLDRELPDEEQYVDIVENLDVETKKIQLEREKVALALDLKQKEMAEQGQQQQMEQMQQQLKDQGDALKHQDKQIKEYEKKDQQRHQYAGPDGKFDPIQALEMSNEYYMDDDDDEDGDISEVQKSILSTLGTVHKTIIANTPIRKPGQPVQTTVAENDPGLVEAGRRGIIPTISQDNERYRNNPQRRKMIREASSNQVESGYASPTEKGRPFKGGL